MHTCKSLTQWLTDQHITFEQLVAQTGLDKKILEAILQGRYTPSPQQRQRVADALQVETEQIQWGHVHQVDHVYGHGPQFGRSP